MHSRNKIQVRALYALLFFISLQQCIYVYIHEQESHSPITMSANRHITYYIMCDTILLNYNNARNNCLHCNKESCTLYYTYVFHTIRLVVRSALFPSTAMWGRSSESLKCCRNSSNQGGIASFPLKAL